MKGMIFAAGIGSRLKPWTDSHPKALAPVAGQPIIARVIDKLLDAGISDIIVNVHHFASQIVDFLHDNYSHVNIAISDESQLLLDTGGGLLRALPLIGNEPVLIHNADILTDFDLHDMIDAHSRSGNDVTLLVQPRDTSRYFLFDEQRLRGWINTSTGECRPADLVTSGLHRLAFGGVHIISPSVFPLLTQFAPADTPFSITNFYINTCSQLRIGGFSLPNSAHWFDVGKPQSLQQASLWASHNFPK